ncbi:hypothetical protein B0H14DRAFT_2594337 [Mycena olivaceomarginata]|nr:hypothetical protein B0H14DRAFT_2594337 [Mycena olivaceomarginata]
MTGGSRHDIINFVMHVWNLIKYLQHDNSASDSAHLDMKLTQSSAAELLAAERLNALQLFELHMAVVMPLRSNLALTVESTLAAMITVEQEKLKRDGQHEAGTSVAQWIHNGMALSVNTMMTNWNPNYGTQKSSCAAWRPRALSSREEGERFGVLGDVQQLPYGPHPPQAHGEGCSGAISTAELSGHVEERNSRLFDGTAWYLQSGVTITDAATTSILSPRKGSVFSPRKGESDSDEPELLAGTQSRKCTSFKHDPRTPKRLRNITPEGMGVESLAKESGAEMLPSKGGKAAEGKKGKTKERGKKKPDGWIWMESLMRGQHESEEKLAAYKKESFRSPSAVVSGLKQKCTAGWSSTSGSTPEFLRIIERYRRDGKVWAGLAEREEGLNGVNGTSTYAHMEAAMRRWLAHNAKVIFKSANSGAHHDWVSTTSFNEMVGKIDKWQDKVTKWMDG